MTRLFFAIAIMLLVSCGGSDKKTFDTKTYQENKVSLEEREKKNPVEFLVASSTDKKNIWGQTKITINVKNKASVCIYKDVKVRIGFYSETGTRLTEEEETIYKSIAPGHDINHKTKYFAPKGTDDVRVTVVEAKVE